MNRPYFTKFDPADIETFLPAMKIGLLASVTDEGLPHITLFASLMASSPKQICFGKFVEGKSFDYFQNNPKIGWMIMSLHKELWRGKATYTHNTKSGKEFDFYNNVPMFRYNAYFGIHTVYYFDLLEQSGKSNLPMNKIIFAAIKTMLSKIFFHKNNQASVMNSWTRNLFNKIDNLKFLAYIDKEGYPTLIPVIQAQTVDSETLIFASGAYTKELLTIPEGIPMAIFGMCLDMTDVLVRGKYLGMRQIGLSKCGILHVDYVYNPMPPVPGQVYPPTKLEPVEIF